MSGTTNKRYKIDYNDATVSEYNPEKLLELLSEENYSKDKLYAYTLAEGDYWNVIVIRLGEVDIINQLTKFNNYLYWKSPYGHDIKLKFHSFMLPDGRIWDSSHKSFRF